MVLGTARRGGLLVVAGRRTALLAAARPANVVAVLPRQLSSNNMPPKAPSAASRERAEFREARLPEDNIEFKDTGFLTTVDRLSNIMFMAEIFRALWLSAEVCTLCSQSFRSSFVRVIDRRNETRQPDPCVYVREMRRGSVCHRSKLGPKYTTCGSSLWPSPRAENAPAGVLSVAARRAHVARKHALEHPPSFRAPRLERECSSHCIHSDLLTPGTPTLQPYLVLIVLNAAVCSTATV